MPHATDDFYKRDEDRQWRQDIDHRLITLLTAQQVTTDRLEDIDDTLQREDKLLRGDPDRETAGILERLHELEASTARLNAVIFQDATGKHGLQRDVQDLKEKREDKRTVLGNWTKIVVAIIMSGLITHLWPEIKGLFIKPKQPDALTQAINKVRQHHEE